MSTIYETSHTLSVLLHTLEMLHTKAPARDGHFLAYDDFMKGCDWIVVSEQLRLVVGLLEGGRRAPALGSSSRCRRYPDSTGGMVDSSLNNAVSALKYFRTEATRSFGRAYGQPGRRPESAGIR